MSELEALFELMSKVRRSDVLPRTAIDRAREYFREGGLAIEPIGVSNIKTQIPSVYRPVGTTCPETCGYLDEYCYAQQGNVLIHQGRATGDVGAFIRSMAIGAIVGHMWFDAPCRLCVSGDLFVFDESSGHQVVDWDLIEEMTCVGRELQGLLNRKNIAWSYTHAEFEDWQELFPVLRDAGISVVLSDFAMVGGCVTWWWEHMDKELPHDPGVRYLKCPAQIAKQTEAGKFKSCAECQWCAHPMDKNFCVVFEPHGPGSDYMPLSCRTPDGMVYTGMSRADRIGKKRPAPRRRK